jgi:protoheme IX farnesyltransferase
MAGLKDWWALTKPRLNFLVLLSALAGYWLAPAGLAGRAAFAGFALPVWILAASSAMLNMWLERDSDALMQRTAQRPLAAKRLDPRAAFWTGNALSALALGLLYRNAGALTAGLGLLTWTSYLLVYTPLKKVTPLSLLVGAVPGALPPVMGWCAAGGALDLRALGLFALMFIWQIPHFLAIAMLYGEQYRAAGIKVLGLEHGQAVVGRQIITYSAALLPLTLWLPQLGLGGNRFRTAPRPRTPCTCRSTPSSSPGTSATPARTPLSAPRMTAWPSPRAFCRSTVTWSSTSHPRT